MYPSISGLNLPSSSSSTTLGLSTEHYILLDDAKKAWLDHVDLIFFTKPLLPACVYPRSQSRTDGKLAFQINAPG
jgi:hypothetical protein